MASRCFYRVTDAVDQAFFAEDLAAFEFHSGFALSQKRHSIQNLHAAIKELFPSAKILEVSTKAEELLGVSLSAFNLPLNYCGKLTTVEAAFQGSKVFQNSGPYRDMLNMPAWEAKKDPRMKANGLAIGYLDGSNKFHSLGSDTKFYDMLYLSALSQNQTLLEELNLFDTFTDIEFNKTKLGLQKGKSFNTQARACAIAIGIYRQQGVDGILNQIEMWSRPTEPSESSPTLF